MEIRIRDRQGKEYLRFSDFKVKSSLSRKQIFITFGLLVTNNSLSAHFDFDAELSDFEEMLNHLEVLNKDLKRIFYFQHSDERVKIKFSPNDLGIITIEGYVFEEGYSSKIEFKFETDQSFLSEIIDQCEQVINDLTVQSL